MTYTGKPTRVAVAGTGWRAEFFMRICAALPERFELCGIMYHSDKDRASVADRGVPPVSTLDELAALKPDYMVLSLKGVAMFDAMRFCAQRGIPALCETFGARTVDELNDMYALLKGARIQFAEQYQFQPLNAARLALARSGALGQVYHVRMSIPTRYHPVSLMRLALGAGQRLPVITARAYSHAVLKGPGRAGDPVGESEFAARQEVVTLDYGDVQAVNDFEDMQHRSFMRSNYFLIRGGRGEIVNEQATWMIDPLTPCNVELKREMAGAGVDLQGLFLRGVSGGAMGWLYTNQFMPARLYDDELAVAECMARMADYARGGAGFWGLEDEFTDMYFAILTGVALDSGDAIRAQRQSWMD